MNCLYLTIFFTAYVQMQVGEDVYHYYGKKKFCICENFEAEIATETNRYIFSIDPPQGCDAEMTIIWPESGLVIEWDEALGYTNVRKQLINKMNK